MDLHHNINPKRVISPVSVSDDTPVVSQIIDRNGFGALEFVIGLGSIADADMTASVAVAHSDAANMSGSEAVPDDQLLGLESGAAFQFDDDNELRKIGYRGAKRYVQLTITPSGNGSAALISAIALLGEPLSGPTAEVPA